MPDPKKQLISRDDLLDKLQHVLASYPEEFPLRIVAVNHAIQSAAVLFAAVVLTGCGGGGSGAAVEVPAPAPAPAPAPPPVSRLSWAAGPVLSNKDTGGQVAGVALDSFGGVVLVSSCDAGVQQGTTTVSRFAPDTGLRDAIKRPTCWPPTLIETRSGALVDDKLAALQGWTALPALPAYANASLPASPAYRDTPFGSPGPKPLTSYSADQNRSLIASRIWSDPFVTSTFEVFRMDGGAWATDRTMTVAPLTEQAGAYATGSYFSFNSVVGTTDTYSAAEMAPAPVLPNVDSTTFVRLTSDRTKPGAIQQKAGTLCPILVRMSECEFSVTPSGELRSAITFVAPSYNFDLLGVFAWRAPASTSDKDWIRLVNKNADYVFGSYAQPRMAWGPTEAAFSLSRQLQLLEGGTPVLVDDGTASGAPLLTFEQVWISRGGRVVLARTADGTSLVYHLRKPNGRYQAAQPIDPQITADDLPLRFDENAGAYTLVVQKRQRSSTGLIQPTGVQVFTGQLAP